MTPEEHIERAEWLLAIPGNNDDRAELATHQAFVHVHIAEYKKKYPTERGRVTTLRYPMGQVGTEEAKPYPALPDNHPMNRGRPIVDDPQA